MPAFLCNFPRELTGGPRAGCGQVTWSSWSQVRDNRKAVSRDDEEPRRMLVCMLTVQVPVPASPFTRYVIAAQPQNDLCIPQLFIRNGGHLWGEGLLSQGFVRPDEK